MAFKAKARSLLLVLCHGGCHSRWHQLIVIQVHETKQRKVFALNFGVYLFLCVEAAAAAPRKHSRQCHCVM